MSLKLLAEEAAALSLCWLSPRASLSTGKAFEEPFCLFRGQPDGIAPRQPDLPAIHVATEFDDLKDVDDVFFPMGIDDSYE